MTKTNGKKTRSYETETGETLEFRPVSSWTINHIDSKWEKDRPLPPKIKTEIGEDENPNDSAYKKELKLWTAAKAADINETCVRLGVVNEPPSDFVETYKAEFPEIEERNIKVHWVYSLLGSQVEEFFEVLIGQTAVTDKGLQESAKSFRSDD
jgi:hypothetical protein